MGKRILGIILACIMLFQLLPLSVLAQEGTAAEVTCSHHTVNDASCTDDVDELFAAYAESLFYPDSAVFASAAGARLTGDEKVLYDALVPLIEEVAAGERASSILTVGQELMYEGTLYPVDSEAVFNEGEMSDESFDRVVTALLSDLPYELYWYDKVTGCFADMFTGSTLLQVSMYFYVDAGYRGADAFTVNGEKANAAVSAVQNAQSIVDAYASATDEEKLLGYRDEICALVEYDFAAAEAGNFTTDCDPWQLIHVFDGDPATKVVCEGYSKAFMYLCDLTGFTGDIACYTVYGQMDGGAHMWNIVSVEGKNYLADVTNSDTGTYGEDGCLFIVGGTGSAAAGYTVSGISFIYDAEILNFWGTDSDSILLLEAEDYVFSEETQPDASGTCGTGVFWRLDGDTLTIYGEGAMADYEEWSDTPWSAHTDSIVKVIITDGVTRIGNSAFGWCYYLADISVPDSVTSIGELAFEDCDALTSIVLPKNLTEIGKYAFYGCTGLERIAIPNGVTVINDSVFSSCYSLSEITLPDGITGIGGSAFAYCSSLTDVYYGGTEEAWTAIANTPDGDYVHYETTDPEGHWTTTTVPATCTEDGYTANVCACGYEKDRETLASGHSFVDGVCSVCSEIEIYASGTCGTGLYWKLDIFGTLTIWGTGAMTNYSKRILNGEGTIAPWRNHNDKIEKCVIEDGVTSLGTYAFWGCSGLTEVTIPDNVTSIGYYAFSGCSGLSSIAIPTEVTTIDSGAFDGCSALTNITIPEGVTSIGDYAFYGCRSLESITIPEGVTSIGNYAFDDCRSLTSITIPDNVTSIGEGAFSGCSGLQSLTIPFVGGSRKTSSDTYQYPFGYIFGITSYTGGSRTPQSYYRSSTKYLYTSTYYIPTSLTSVTVTGGEILVGAFESCYNLTSIDIPDSITSIPNSAFRDCYRLTSITIPEGVTIIGHAAFYDCYRLTGITIPEGVTSIGRYAFADCSSLTGITIPEGVTSISDSAFSGCSSLVSITIPDSVTSIGSSAFEDCSSLESITIPEGVTSIGDYAFYYCSSLDDIYYGGTKEEWTALSRKPSADRIHYSVTDPTNHWSTIRVTATCTEGGHTTKECPCGHERFVYQNAFGHSFVNGSCTRCGKPEPGTTHPMLESVTRVYGSTRYDTSFKSADTLKDLMGVDQFQNIIVASGDNFPDALAGSYLASVKEAPILLVNSGTVNSVKAYIRENLAPGGTVYLLGGTGVVPTSMETGLIGFTVKRLGGATRYDTNLKILQEAGIGDRDILVCTGTGFADSLSASAVGLPILLVGTSLTSAQRSLLSTCSGDIIIVGGWGAVSDSVASQLAAYGPVERLSGSTRYETSTMVAERFFNDPTNAVLAYAENFPDGLSGGPIANRIGAPLILTMTGRETAAARYSSTYGIRHGIILGGPTLIGDKAIRSVFSLGSDVTIATR